MRGEPTIDVCCDRCRVYADTVGLTVLARGGYDERNVDGALERFGWRIEDGKEICPDCVEREGGDDE